jgi:Fe-S-cluster containining protein
MESFKMKEEVSCSTCKALCCRLEVRLIDDADEKIPVELTEQVDSLYYVMKRERDGWCVALDRETMLCSIYEQRPFICRDYELGDYDCINERNKYLPL